jgi:hypothetical protein
MAATATARKSTRPAARRSAAPKRRPASSRPTAPKRRARSHATPIPGRLVPVAVGATAGAVGGLADSGLVVRLTRGRLWIGALAVLLVGIVGLNVMALSLNASSSKTGRQADALKQQNSALRAQLAGEVTSQKVQQLALDLGLVFPEPGAIRYVEPQSGDAAEAARRLRAGDLALAAVAPIVPVATTEVAPTTDSTTTPSPPEEAAAEPTAAAPETSTPAETAPVGGATGGGGGVASP